MLTILSGRSVGLLLGTNFSRAKAEQIVGRMHLLNAVLYVVRDL